MLNTSENVKPTYVKNPKPVSIGIVIEEGSRSWRRKAQGLNKQPISRALLMYPTRLTGSQVRGYPYLHLHLQIQTRRILQHKECRIVAVQKCQGGRNADKTGLECSATYQPTHMH